MGFSLWLIISSAHGSKLLVTAEVVRHQSGLLADLLRFLRAPIAAVDHLLLCLTTHVSFVVPTQAVIAIMVKI